jgi:crotonobetainyl-CoA:carnitine CoA-transferase CaiB-like acyl-CoA transferase
MAMAGPFAGLRVLEFGNAMAGPYCGMMLADYGAEVVKVERMGVGDDSRVWSPFFHGAVAAYFASANRNKKSLAIDIKTPEGVGLIKRLIPDTDILIDNYRLGALERAGLGYDALSAINPRLIYASISGFGASGPLRHRPANDLFMQAYSGGMSITGYPEGDPVKMGLSVCDIGAGMMATMGVQMALLVRMQTGRGQRVDTSLLEGQVSMLSYHITRYFASGEVPKPSGSGGLGNPTYRAYRTADDYVVIACFNQRLWEDLCRALDRESWIADPRFATSKLRTEHKEALMTLLEEVFAPRPADDWLQRMEARSVPCSRINDVAQMAAEEQVAARDLMVDLDLEGLGPMRMGGLPIKLSETPGAVHSAPPRLGQHTRDVLERLGLPDAEIDGLAAKGVVGLDYGWALPGTPAAAE